MRVSRGAWASEAGQTTRHDLARLTTRARPEGRHGEDDGNDDGFTVLLARSGLRSGEAKARARRWGVVVGVAGSRPTSPSAAAPGPATPGHRRRPALPALLATPRIPLSTRPHVVRLARPLRRRLARAVARRVRRALAGRLDQLCHRPAAQGQGLARAVQEAQAGRPGPGGRHRRLVGGVCWRRSAPVRRLCGRAVRRRQGRPADAGAEGQQRSALVVWPSWRPVGSSVDAGSRALSARDGRALDACADAWPERRLEGRRRGGRGRRR